ncbi:hypothetical protein TNCV_1451301 [Trichonephila clavipes]|nr:hypothetical protein TNCV_1451301 [Trichonephila clavipes]
MTPKGVSRLWNQLQTSGIVSRMVGQDHHRAITPVQNRYVASSTERHRRTTAPQLARELIVVSGKRISGKTVNRRLAANVFYPWLPVVCVPLTASNRKDRLLSS